MKGTMNTKFVGNELETQQYLVEMVEKVLGTNATLVGGVSSVRYVGDRGTFYNPSLYQPPPLTISSVSNQNDSGMQSLGTDIVIGTAVGLAVVVTLLAGLFVTRSVRMKLTKKARSESRMSITSIEIDAGSVDTKETQASMDDSSLTACDVDSFIEEEEPSSSDNPDMADIPPIALKSVSLPSKRKRRRKKKKKRKKNVMGLTRSNSVNSMDTITEEDEQDHDDYGSEYGTEYSTDDEDQDLNRTDSCDPWSEPWDSSPQSIPLEEIVESPKIRRLPPPPV
jgi:hypothetical protein